jgi:hypothetical protein
MSKLDQKTGVDLIKSPVFLITLLLALILSGYQIANNGLMAGLLVLAIPFLFTYLFLFIKNPSVGIISLVVISYLVPALSRYVITNIGLGLSIDILIAATYISVLLKGNAYQEKWKLIKSDLFLVSLLWLLYNIIELFNPLALSNKAWIYAIRSVSLYFILIIPLVFVLGSTKKYLMLFLYIWAGFSILASIKGIIQLHIGLDPWEAQWMAQVGYKTHLLFGKLRVFSFMSDAGQFGAAQGHMAVVGLILFTGLKSLKARLYFLVAGLLAAYGMMISGTRGALAVPFIGVVSYVILRKDWRYILLVGALGAGMFAFLKYTYIGNGNYIIYRMRTAFDPNDASFQTRLYNQRIFKAYLKDKPFGGGVGSAGYWGSRFSPGTFLADLPTDSWYVQIWAEQGIVGLILYLIMLLYILGKSFFIVLFKLKSKQLRLIMTALAAGLFGVLVASYGNNVIGQLPTSIMTYFSIVYLFGAEKLEEEFILLDNDISQNPTS